MISWAYFKYRLFETKWKRHFFDKAILSLAKAQNSNDYEKKRLYFLIGIEYFELIE